MIEGCGPSLDYTWLRFGDYQQTPEHDRDESVSDIAKAYKWVSCLLNPQPETRNP